MKDEILEQIDKLKMMVILDSTPPVETELGKFDKWVEKLQGRCPEDFRIGCPVFDPKDYQEYALISAQVDQLYKDKYGGNKKYAENQPEIRRMIKNIVAMTLFYKQLSHKEKK